MNEQVPVREAGVFLPGDIIERKYRIVRLLAEGGMGSVYHAVQEPLGRDVALKVLKPGNDSPEQREGRLKRFFREASVSSRLQHPNTVMIFDYGELAHDQGFFLTMEFLHGYDLRALIPAGTYLDTSLAIHIAMQIAGSLAEAHAAGVVHRDLKPPNVMIVERGGDPYFVKVVDFGLVKDLADDTNDELTAENTLLGSPVYMAPERFLSKDADSAAVDIYALGIMLYEMLVGRPPFKREGEATIHQLIMEQIQADPPPMRTFRPDLMLPDGLEALIMRCLAKNAEDRIASMDVLLRMLKSIANQLDGFSTNGSFEFPVPTLEQNSDVLRFSNDTGSGVFPHTQETVLSLEKQRASAQISTSSTAPATAQPSQTTGQRQHKILITAIGVLIVFILAMTAFLAFSPKDKTNPVDTMAFVQPPIELFAQSEPTGAIVYLADQELGRTPLRITMPLPAGSNLRFSLEDFEDYDYTVPATQNDNVGETLRVRALLVHAKDLETLHENALDDPAAIAHDIVPDLAPVNTKTKSVAKPVKKTQKPPSSSKKPSGSSNTQKAPPERPSHLDIKLDR